VLLHGNGGGAAEWDRVLGLLPPDQPVVCPEAPGHGNTPGSLDAGRRPGRPWSGLFPPKLRLQKTAQLLADGLTRVGLTGPGAAVIVGFSDGANVALELAAHRPEAAAGLLLIGANARPGGLRARTHASVLLGYAALRAWGVVSERARQRARVWGLMVGQPLLRAEQLGRIGVPTVVMAGGADMIARSHTARLAAQIPGARTVIVPREGHFLPAAAPRMVSDGIGRVLRLASKRGATGQNATN
jgi:pimeloyl-ACP methyl ester carboxylesterase